MRSMSIASKRLSNGEAGGGLDTTRSCRSWSLSSLTGVNVTRGSAMSAESKTPKTSYTSIRRPGSAGIAKSEFEGGAGGGGSSSEIEFC